MISTIAREMTMKLAYALMLNGDDDYRTVIEQSDISDIPSIKDMEYSDKLLNGMQGKKEYIDSIISKNTRGWSLDRLPKVELAILRIAVYEMLFDEHLNDAVAINAAVELAKTYGNEKAYKYINGILGTISREKESGELKKYEIDKEENMVEDDSIVQEVNTDSELDVKNEQNVE